MLNNINIHKEEIDKQVNKLLENSIIKPSTSPYHNPHHFGLFSRNQLLKEKKWRMVIDFRKLTEKTVGNAYPLPNIVEILDQLGNAKYFFIFDLAQGFYQIPMNLDDMTKTTFSTPYRYYKYQRMPFGLKNALVTFQRLMDNVLQARSYRSCNSGSGECSLTVRLFHAACGRNVARRSSVP